MGAIHFTHSSLSLGLAHSRTEQTHVQLNTTALVENSKAIQAPQLLKCFFEVHFVSCFV